MGVNGYQGQLIAAEQPNGYFAADEELMDLIQAEANGTVDYVQRIGVYGRPPQKFRLNNEQFQIGKTGIYQARNTEINSIQFVQNSSKQATIDFIVYIMEEDEDE